MPQTKLPESTLSPSDMSEQEQAFDFQYRCPNCNESSKVLSNTKVKDIPVQTYFRCVKCGYTREININECERI
jgi:transcription elongation factor Elf1